MRRSASASPAKRRRTLSEDGACQTPAKRRCAPLHAPGPAFWNALSTIWLSRAALVELDRRNNENRPRPFISRATPVERRRLRKVSALPAVKTFARHGGPDLTQLRSYPRPPIPAVRSRGRGRSRGRSESAVRSHGALSRRGSSRRHAHSSDGTETSRHSGPYDPNFTQHLIDAGIFPHGYSDPVSKCLRKPSDFAQIRAMLQESRPTLSVFDEATYSQFETTISSVRRERGITDRVLHWLEGNVGDEACRGAGTLFNNLDPLASEDITAGSPDLWYGSRPELLNARIRKELGSLIVPSTQTDLPIAPNFFCAAKGPSGTFAVLLRQAHYDGALGARAMHALESYADSEPSYGETKAISSTLMGNTLTFYSTYLENHPSGLRYWQSQLKTFPLADDIESCQAGIGAFQNAMVWAAQQRDAAIQRANATVGTMASKEQHMSEQSTVSAHRSLSDPWENSPNSDTSLEQMDFARAPPKATVHNQSSKPLGKRIPRSSGPV